MENGFSAKTAASWKVNHSSSHWMKDNNLDKIYTKLPMLETMILSPLLAPKKWLED